MQRETSLEEFLQPLRLTEYLPLLNNELGVETLEVRRKQKSWTSPSLTFASLLSGLACP
jgi:hypothetical protein